MYGLNEPYMPFHQRVLKRIHLNSKSHDLNNYKTWGKVLRRLMKLRNILIFIWVCALYYGERMVFRNAIEECQWDNWENWPSGSSPHRIALIADPQLVDPHTYPRRGIALAATMFYADTYMRKSYSLLNSILIPQTIIFLGDLFDGGREWNPGKLQEGYGGNVEWDGHVEDPRAMSDWKTHGQVYWEKEFVRFNKVFPPFPGRRIIRSLPGNHDLGIGNGINEAVLNRFKVFFGDTNSVHRFGNHTFVLIDSVSLSNTVNPRIYGPPKKFLDEFPVASSDPIKTPARHSLAIQEADELPTQAEEYSQNPVTLPRILLTHVPLYRPPDTSCGPLRESYKNSIAIRGGFQYQNVLLPDLSADVLRKVKPILVFSGDDHDYCEVTHAEATSAGGGTGMVKEITVKSFSLAMGVRKPGFLLLSLWNPVKPGGEDGFTSVGPTVQTKLCLLPDQLGVLKFYALVGMFMKIAVSLRVVWAWLRRRKNKEEDDDNNVNKTAGPLSATTTEYAISSSSSSSTSGMSTRVSGSTVPKSTSNGYGYGIPVKQYSDDDDKYNKKYHPAGSPPTALGLGITNLATLAEKAHLSTLTHHPVVQDGVRIVKGEMMRYKCREKALPLLREVVIYASCVGGWYLWLLFTNA